MLPFINIPDTHIGPIPIHVFGIIVAIAVLVGIWLARRRVAYFPAVDPDKLESMINWMLLSGFAFCHIFDEIFYHPDEIARRPWSLLFFWEGLSSIGGLAGAAIGIFLWKRYRARNVSLLQYADLILSVYPIAWVIGRLGCSVEHDHKGAATAVPTIFTVAFPDGPHYDLGLLEMLYSIVISLVVMSLWRKKRTPGTYIWITCVMYAPVRFFLDFLRLDTGPTGDRRYLDLTFAQWSCVVLLGFGIYMMLKTLRRARSSDA